MALGVYAALEGRKAAGLWLTRIGLILLATSRAAFAQLDTKTAFEGRTVADLMTPHRWTADPDQSLSDLVNRGFLEHGIRIAPVVENGTLIGYVDLQFVRKIDREHWTTTTVADAIECMGAENTVTPSLAGLDLISPMVTTGRRKILVVDQSKLMSVIAVSDVVAYLSVFREAV